MTTSAKAPANAGMNSPTPTGSSANITTEKISIDSIVLVMIVFLNGGFRLGQDQPTDK